MLHIKCPNEEIKTILQSLYYDILNIEHNLFGWARTMCKYGDLFLYLDLDDKTGVKSCIGIPSQEIERLEGEDETNPNYVDPLPQAMVLTAIVIGLATTAMLMAIAIRLYRKYKTFDIREIKNLKG